MFLHDVHVLIEVIAASGVGLFTMRAPFDSVCESRTNPRNPIAIKISIGTHVPTKNGTKNCAGTAKKATTAQVIPCTPAKSNKLIKSNIKSKNIEE
jgi:hypothetical protein